MWNTEKVICPLRAASRKPMSRSALSVGESSPARTSIMVTADSLMVSKICIWSGIFVTSTTSVTSG